MKSLRSWSRELIARLRPGARTGRRNFNGAATGRLAGGWNSRNTSINADLYRALDTLRARSRDLCSNNDYAKRFLGMVAANVVGGTGVVLQARVYDSPKRPDTAANAALERSWARWGERGVCDVTGRLSLREIENLVIKGAARDGEPLIRIVRGAAAGNEFGFALQLLDIDRLDTRLVRAGANSVNEIKMGVEVDDFGRPVAYWLRPYHANEIFLAESTQISSDHVRIPASDIIHPFITDRPEQVRGVPWMHAAMTRLNNLGGYEEAAVIAARVGASKMGFFQTPDGTPPADGEDDEGVPFTEVEPGQFGTLPTGSTFVPFNPDYPHQMYEQFVKACLRGVSSGLGVAYHALANDLTSVSFSSIRSGTLEERDQWMAIQAWFIEAFLEPIYRQWLQAALAFGQVKLDNGSALSVAKIEKFSAHAWQPRRWQWVDPRADMEANILAIENGFKSRQSICAELGVDFEDVLVQLRAEQDLAEQLGVKLGKPAPQAPATQPAPAETVEATGKAIASALAGLPAPQGHVDNRAGDVVVEAHLPSADALVLERAEEAARAAAVAAEQASAAVSLLPAFEGLATAQKATAEAIERSAKGTASQLDRLAQIGMADRVPVFDDEGNPTRSRVDLPH
jgi:lambda family phage portal protein